MAAAPNRSRLAALAAVATLSLIAAGWSLLGRRGGDAPKAEERGRTEPLAVAPDRAPAGAPATADGGAGLPRLEGTVLAIGCRQGECRWARVARLERLTAGAQGELRRLVARRGSSLHRDDPPSAWSADLPVEWEEGEASDYAFCSTARPAYAFPGETGEGLIIHYLDFHDLAGYQLASAGLYMRVCHGIGFVDGDEATLRRLGYRPGTRSGQIEGAVPEELTRF